MSRRASFNAYTFRCQNCHKSTLTSHQVLSACASTMKLISFQSLLIVITKQGWNSPSRPGLLVDLCSVTPSASSLVAGTQLHMQPSTSSGKSQWSITHRCMVSMSLVTQWARPGAQMSATLVPPWLLVHLSLQYVTNHGHTPQAHAHKRDRAILFLDIHFR